MRAYVHSCEAHIYLSRDAQIYFSRKAHIYFGRVRGQFLFAPCKRQSAHACFMFSFCVRAHVCVSHVLHTKSVSFRCSWCENNPLTLLIHFVVMRCLFPMCSVLVVIMSTFSNDVHKVMHLYTCLCTCLMYLPISGNTCSSRIARLPYSLYQAPNCQPEKYTDFINMVRTISIPTSKHQNACTSR